MIPDGELLRRYAKTGSEAAFAELVQRHAALVYSAAHRQLNGDAHLAHDVAQTVFTALARKAASLSSRNSLTGWLYTSTHFAAAKAIRSASRRRVHEQEAHTMQELLRDSHSDSEWDQIQPWLDHVMHELKESDREVILLRYFENHPLAIIGEKLGLTEDAARKRVDRALEKLRHLLSRRGITASSLAATLSVNAVQVVPAGLAATLAGAALTGAATGGATTLTLFKLMAFTKTQIATITAAMIACVAIPIAIHQRAELRQANDSLRERENHLAALEAENQRLTTLAAQAKRRASLHLPAPAMTPMPAATAPAETVTRDRIAQLLRSNESPRLRMEQVEPYLKANQRNAGSLLAAFYATGDDALLREAMEKYPNDPLVNFAAVHRKDAPPEERRQWIENFKKAVPDNAVANYISALDYFKAGQTDQAVQEMIAASGKQKFQTYRNESLQNSEDIWRTAGYPEAEAKTIASMSLLLPQLAEMKQLGQNLTQLANSYQLGNDSASAQTALQMVVDIGRHLNGGEDGGLMVNELVGIAIERNALSSQAPANPYGNSGQTVAERLAELNQQREEISQLAKQVETLYSRITPADMISYVDRLRSFGELAAGRWLVNKYQQP